MVEKRDNLLYLYYRYVNAKDDLEKLKTTLLTKLEVVNAVIDDLDRELTQSGYKFVSEHWEYPSKSEDESEDEEWETFYNESGEDE